MSRKFQEFMREVEAEARRAGSEAVAELAAFDAHFRLAGELLALRKSRGLTQRQLAEKTGVHQSEISRIEAAHANPTLDTVAVLAGALGAEFRLVTGGRQRAVKARLSAARRIGKTHRRAAQRSR
jgi:transcriptional regulator with XRE-family HTH domain